MNEETNYSSILDIRSLASVLWNGKFIIVFFFLLSIPVSFYYVSRITPLYMATSIIEVSVRGVPNSPGQNIQLSTAFMKMDSGGLGRSSSFLPKVTGQEFLKILINSSEKLREPLNKLCSYGGPSKPSILRVFLGKMGLVQTIVPNEEQKYDMVVNCIRSMLTVREYVHGNSLTPAHSIVVKSVDPFFAADLANEIVKQFFLLEKKESEARFKRVSLYLSETIAEAQLQLNVAEKKLEDFTIKYAEYIGTNVKGASGSDGSMALKAAIKDKIYKLAKTESYENKLIDTLNNIKGLEERSVGEIDIFVKSVGVTGGLSGKFVSEISKLVKISKEKDSWKPSLADKVNSEVLRLERLVKINKQQVLKKENEVANLMNLENQLTGLEFNAKKRALYFQNLESQLTTNALDAEVNMLEDNKVYTKATPPLFPYYPNKKALVVTLAIFFVSMGVALVLFLQSLQKVVFSVTQLYDFREIKNKFQLSLKKDLRDFDPRSEGSRKKWPFPLQFHADLNKTGKVGCIIDLSEGRSANSSAAERFSRYVSKLMPKSENTLLFLSGISKKPFSILSSRNRDEQIDLNEDKKSIGNNKLSVIRDDERLLWSSNFFPIKSDFKNFDRIIVSLEAGISDLAKFDAISYCDFYILIGQAGKFNTEILDKFTGKLKDRDIKCVGFFLLT